MNKFANVHDQQLIADIKSGAVGVLLTDTVYGLVASAANIEAVERLYHLKAREQKPGTLMAASIDQLVELGLQRRYLTAVKDFWPNPLSIIIPVGPELDYLSQNQRTLAVRIPADETVRTLLEQTGPLATSSANQPGEPPATNITEAEAYFGDSVDYYVDSGQIGERPPSTVIRMVDDAIEIIRAGAVNIDEHGRITK